jgi:hypothetical protein
MPFSQASVSDVRVVADGPELFVCWSTTAPSGTRYQVYVNKRLAWSGRSTRCHVPFPVPSAGWNLWVDVGTVDPADATTDFSSSLPAPTGLSTRAQLSWLGGTYLDPTGNDDVRGFRIYGPDTPGGAVDYTTILATIPAYPGGWITDGFGLGGFGQGGFGRAATSYQWESGPLASGAWTFAVVPYDAAGNARPPGQVATVTIAEAPLPPAAAADGTLLSYNYNGPTARTATLTWLPSPSQG